MRPWQPRGKVIITIVIIISYYDHYRTIILMFKFVPTLELIPQD